MSYFNARIPLDIKIHTSLIAAEVPKLEDISDDELWLMHAKQIAKKGKDLNGQVFKGTEEQRKDIALQVVNTLLKDDVVQNIYHDASKSDFSTIHIIPPMKNLYNNVNFLVYAYVKVLGERLQCIADQHSNGITFLVDPNLVSTKNAGTRTETDALGRLIRQKDCRYIGSNDSIAVIFVDDAIEAGSTTAKTISALVEKNIPIIATTVLTCLPESISLKMADALREALLLKNKESEIDQVLESIGLSVDALTNREGLIVLAALSEPSEKDSFLKLAKRIGVAGQEGQQGGLEELIEKPSMSLDILQRYIDEELPSLIRSMIEKDAEVLERPLFTPEDFYSNIGEGKLLTPNSVEEVLRNNQFFLHGVVGMRNYD